MSKDPIISHKPIETYTPRHKPPVDRKTLAKVGIVALVVIITGVGVGGLVVGGFGIVGAITSAIPFMASIGGFLTLGGSIGAVSGGAAILLIIGTSLGGFAIYSVVKFVRNRMMANEEPFIYDRDRMYQSIDKEPKCPTVPPLLKINVHGYEDVELQQIGFIHARNSFFHSSFVDSDQAIRKSKDKWKKTFCVFYISEDEGGEEFKCKRHGIMQRWLIRDQQCVIFTFNEEGKVTWANTSKPIRISGRLPLLISKFATLDAASKEVTRLLKAGYKQHIPKKLDLPGADDSSDDLSVPPPGGGPDLSVPPPGGGPDLSVPPPGGGPGSDSENWGDLSYMEIFSISYQFFDDNEKLNKLANQLKAKGRLPNDFEVDYIPIMTYLCDHEI